MIVISRPTVVAISLLLKTIPQGFASTGVHQLIPGSFASFFDLVVSEYTTAATG
jgi:hypothetical protein